MIGQTVLTAMLPEHLLLLGLVGVIVTAVFALGLFPDEPMRKTELAAKEYRQLVATPRLPASRP